MAIRISTTAIYATTLITFSVLLTGCMRPAGPVATQDGPPRHYVNINNIPNAKPRYLPKSRYGNPTSYVIAGRRYYVLKTAKGYNKRGIASWYGTKFNGRLTSTRERYNMFAMTAASPVLPIPTFVRVTNLQNGRQVIVKVNDRGPFAPNRIIDMSYTAAKKLGFERRGTAMVQVTAIDTTNPNDTPVVAHLNHPHLYMQLGAFEYQSNAERLKTQLTQVTQRQIRIKEGLLKSHPIYRVQIGPLATVEESDRLMATLKHDGFGQGYTVIN